jgi:hypothetical protein
MNKSELMANVIFRVVIAIGVIGSIRFACDKLSNYLFMQEALSEQQYFWLQFIEIATPFIIVLAMYFMGKWVIKLFKDDKVELKANEQGA